MRSVGIDLAQLVRKGFLRFCPIRITDLGLEAHLLLIHSEIVDFSPEIVVFDPVSNFVDAGSKRDARSMLTRLFDFVKSKGITNLSTNLIPEGPASEITGITVSSWMDTDIVLHNVEAGGEYNRCIRILKSRGMAHSDQVSEFLLTSNGIRLTDVYTGPAGVLTGSLRASQEASEKAEKTLRELKIESKEHELEVKHEAFEAKLHATKAEFNAEKIEAETEIAALQIVEKTLANDRERSKRRRSRIKANLGKAKKTKS